MTLCNLSKKFKGLDIHKRKKVERKLIKLDFDFIIGGS